MLRRLLIALMLMLSCVATKTAIADDVVTNYPPTAAQRAETAAETTGKQVLNLPQDENKLYLTLYGNPDDEKYQNLKKWFNENADLRAIRQQTHFSAIDTNSKLFKERYADEVDSKLCIRFVTPGGVELLRIDGTKIPMSDASLNKGIRTNLIKRLFNNDGDEDQGNRNKKKRPDQKFKDAMDKKIDNDIDLPPVATAVFGPIIHLAVYSLFAVVVLIFGVVGVVSAIKKHNAAQ